MTREEGLDWLCRLRSEIYVYMPKEWLIPMNNALDMAIKALEQEPTDKSFTKADIDAIVKAINAGWELRVNEILDKIREQIKSHLRGVEISLEVLVENDPLRPMMEGAKDTLEECLEIIDRAETETEDGQ